MDDSDRPGPGAFRVSHLPAGGWRIPNGLRLAGDSLTWDPAASDVRPRQVTKPTRAVLTEFVRLSTAEPVDLPEAVLAFAQRWGVLSACSQHPDQRHPMPAVFGGPFVRQFVPPPEAASEPLDWWRVLAARYRALLDLTVDVGQTGGAGSDDAWANALPQVSRITFERAGGPTIREVLGPDDPSLDGLSSEILDSPAAPDIMRVVTAPPAGIPLDDAAGRRIPATLLAAARRGVLAAALSELLRSEHVAPRVDFTGNRFVAGYAVGGLTGALTLAAYLGVLGGRVPCSVCGELVSPRVSPPMCDRDRRAERERAKRARLREQMTPDQLAESRRAEAARKRAQRAQDREGGTR